MQDDIKSHVLKENIRVHSAEAGVYDLLHAELNNNCILKGLFKDIDFIMNNIHCGSPQVLDLGAGTGYLTIPFLKKGCAVCAVDASDKMLDICESKARALGVKGRARFFVGEAGRFLSNLKGEKFTIVSMSSFLHHVYNYRNILDMSDDCLAPGGILFIAWEPLCEKYNYFSIPAKIIDYVDNKFFRINALMRKMWIPDLDYSYADYHVNMGNGFDPGEIINYFMSKGYTLLRSEFFSGTGKSAAAAWMHNRFNLSQDHFKIILQKGI